MHLSHLSSLDINPYAFAQTFDCLLEENSRLMQPPEGMRGIFPNVAESQTELFLLLTWSCFLAVSQTTLVRQFLKTVNRSVHPPFLRFITCITMQILRR